MVYRFAEYQVDPSARILLRHGAPVSLSAPCFLLLQTLLEQSGTVVSRQTLLHAIGSSGTDGSRHLESVLAELRRALEETDGSRWIEETADGGVRFTGVVSTEEAEGASPALPPTMLLPGLDENELFRLQSRPARSSHVHWVVALLLMAGLAAVLYISHGSRPEPLPVILSSRQLTHSGRKAVALVLNRSGETAWYTEQGDRLQLWQLSLPDDSAHPLAPTLFDRTIEDISADGERLLVRCGSPENKKDGPPAGLWETDRSGGNARLLIANGWSGAWSPNGRKLAYSRTGDHAIYLANADGSHARVLARVPGYPGYLTWAPEGDRLVLASVVSFLSAGLFPEGLLYRVYMAIGGIRPIKDDTGNPVSGATPRFASDRRHILFTHTAGDTANIWEIDRQNGHLLAVTSNPVNTRLAALGPAPNQIILSRENLHAHLFRLQQRKLVPFSAPIKTRDMAFSPDGKWIAYVDLEGALWQAKVDGSEPVRLLQAKWKASQPAWAPDSRQLVVAAAPQGGLPKLYRLPAMRGAADSAANAITTGMGADQDASWAPDGKHILFCRTVSGASQLNRLNLDSGSLQAISDSRDKCFPAVSSGDVWAATDDANQALFIRRGINGAWDRILTDLYGIRQAHWSHDGGSLYFLAGGPSRHATEATAWHASWKWERYDLRSGRITTLADLGPSSEWILGPWHSVALTADDELVISFDNSGSEFYVVTLGSDE